jgi:iron complex transport system permease protein
VSAGAGLGAALAIVLGDRLPQGLAGLGSSLLPAAAFIGALAATSTLYAVATRGGRTSVATMLLAGVALAALASSFIGIFAYVSTTGNCAISPSGRWARWAAQTGSKWPRSRR